MCQDKKINEFNRSRTFCCLDSKLSPFVFLRASLRAQKKSQKGCFREDFAWVCSCTHFLFFVHLRARTYRISSHISGRSPRIFSFLYDSCAFDYFFFRFFIPWERTGSVQGPQGYPWISVDRWISAAIHGYFGSMRACVGLYHIVTSSLVGHGGLEPPTSVLSGLRSNHVS